MALGLPARDLYDAQGNAFDRLIVGLRLGPLVQDHLADPDPARHHFPDADALCALYQATADAIHHQWPQHASSLARCPLDATDTAGASLVELLRRPIADSQAAAPLG